MRSWPSLWQHLTQPSAPSSSPVSTTTLAEGQRPRSGHQEVWTSWTAMMLPAAILPKSSLAKSSARLSTTVSKMRYLAPACHGSCTPLWLWMPRMLERGATAEPGVMLRRCSSTTCGPRRFTGYSSRSPVEVSGLIQPIFSSSVLTIIRRRTPVPMARVEARIPAAAAPVPTPRSRTRTSSPGFTSSISGLDMSASARIVAGFFTM
mmetsp:Transcript_43604/g.125883  ORF Transcript_43604/g.125883 Transcript_43604/m.125883 type:complete len:206 (-) Transcript_43604:558-1175(-)